MDDELWVLEASRFDRMLEPYGEALLDTLAVRAGESVLDVGCGGGTTTMALAHEVGPTGCVTGIDVSARLLALAGQRVAALANVALVEADAGTYDYKPESFDAVASRMGMMLFDDPAKAFTNLAGSLRTGGRVVFATWCERAANLWSTLPMAAVAAHLALPESEPPPAFALASPACIHEVCAKAGLREVRMTRVETRVWIARDVPDAVAFFERSAGNLRAMLPDDVANRIVATLRMSLAPYAEGDGVRLPSAAWIVSSVAGSCTD
jgi:SAM-dependent methyltransferase